MTSQPEAETVRRRGRRPPTIVSAVRTDSRRRSRSVAGRKPRRVPGRWLRNRSTSVRRRLLRWPSAIRFRCRHRRRGPECAGGCGPPPGTTSLAVRSPSDGVVAAAIPTTNCRYRQQESSRFTSSLTSVSGFRGRQLSIRQTEKSNKFFTARNDYRTLRYIYTVRGLCRY